nr:PQQ-binding-like beta-propeller repeat protein [Natronococcus sp.]
MVSSAALATGTALAAAGTSSANESPDAPATPDRAEPDGWSSHGGTIGNCRHIPSSDGLERPDTIAWQYEHSGPASVVEGAVFLQTDGEIHSLDAADGSLRWTADAVEASGTPAVAGDSVYVAGGGSRRSRPKPARCAGARRSATPNPSSRQSSPSRRST